MAHELQDRYSPLVLAKIREEQVLKTGVCFNDKYEGTPTAGSVKIPVRDLEVEVSDYDKANGATTKNGSTTYKTLNIDKDKSVNEVIDGYDAAAVPDNLIVDRLESAAYSMSKQVDKDKAACLLAGASDINWGEVTKDNIYSMFVALRTAYSAANIPINGRYALVTPDIIGVLLESPQFTKATDYGDEVVKTGAIGKIAGFLVIEFNNDTENLAVLCGHPDFATSVEEFGVPIELVSLKGSGNFIGASAVQGRLVYGQMVLRSAAFKAVKTNNCVTATFAVGTSTGDTKVTATAGVAEGTTLAYKKNPQKPAFFGISKGTYNGTDLTSGTATAITGCVAGDKIEVLEFDDKDVCISIKTVTLVAANIKA